VLHMGERFPPDLDIRNNGYGGTSEILAFVSKYNVSVEIHAPETYYIIYITMSVIVNYIFRIDAVFGFGIVRPRRPW
jgi:hypothetical protein